MLPMPIPIANMFVIYLLFGIIAMKTAVFPFNRTECNIDEVLGWFTALFDDLLQDTKYNHTLGELVVTGDGIPIGAVATMVLIPTYIQVSQRISSLPFIYWLQSRYDGIKTIADVFILSNQTLAAADVFICSMWSCLLF